MSLTTLATENNPEVSFRPLPRQGRSSRVLESFEFATRQQARLLGLTRRANGLWKAEFAYFKIRGWGWSYLSTVLGDHSRYILAWKATATIAITDVPDPLERALATAGPETVYMFVIALLLLSDNGPCYVSAELRRFLKTRRIEHALRAPCHSMT